MKIRAPCETSGFDGFTCKEMRYCKELRFAVCARWSIFHNLRSQLFPLFFGAILFIQRSQDGGGAV